jgi:LigXa C-terminal domain like
VDVSRRAGTAAAAGVRVDRASCVASVLQQALAGMQLPAGNGRWDRSEPRLLPARGRAPYRSATPRHQGANYQQDRSPKFEVVESEGGLYIGARRNAEPGHCYWRITQWIMPWYTMVRPYGDNALNAHAWVPIDDENCFTWTFTYHPTRPLTATELETMRKGGGIHVELVPGAFRPVINKDNDYMIDRAAQKAAAPTAASNDCALLHSVGSGAPRTCVKSLRHNNFR